MKLLQPTPNSPSKGDGEFRAAVRLRIKRRISCSKFGAFHGITIFNAMAKVDVVIGGCVAAQKTNSIRMNSAREKNFCKPSKYAASSVRSVRNRIQYAASSVRSVLPTTKLT